MPPVHRAQPRIQDPRVIELDSDDESSLVVVQQPRRLKPTLIEEPVSSSMMTNACPRDAKTGVAQTITVPHLKEAEFALMDKIRPVRMRRFRRSSTNSQSSSSDEKPPVTSTVQIFNQDVTYRQSGSIVHFKLESILELIQQIIPLSSDIRECKAVVKLVQEKADESSWRKDFVSWSALKSLIHDGIYNQAIKDMLNTYQPFEDRSPKTKDSRLVDDTITIVGVEIAFIVCKGKIYLEILGSFTILGELKLAMRNKWQPVDKILSDHGIRQREAFRRCYKSTAATEKASYSQRSHIALTSLQVLVQSDLLSSPERKEMLLKLFDHIEKRADFISKRRDRLLSELQLHIDMILRSSSYTPRTSSLSSEDDEIRYFTASSEDESMPSGSEGGGGMNSGTESCGSSCGRQYHFTTKCCADDHFLQLDDKSVGFIIKGGDIFLEKCSTFAALGRMYVIRCSDYRKADKILTLMSLDPDQHYLYEKRNYISDKAPRNRRTHISLTAVKILVGQGFADPTKTLALKESLKAVEAESERLKATCQSPLPADVLSPVATHAATFASTRPIQLKAEEAPQPLMANGDDLIMRKVLGRDIPSRVEHSKIFLHLSSVSNFLSDEDRLVPRLKRRARLLDVKFPFFPSYFKKGADQFIAAECLFKLIERKLVSPLGGQTELLKDDLKRLITEETASLKARKEGAHPAGGKSVSPGRMNFYNDDEDDADADDDTEDGGAEEMGLEDIHDASISFLDDKARVRILQGYVPFQLVNDVIYLDLASIFTLFHSSGKEPTTRSFRAMDRLVEQAKICLDDAFLYEGRRRAFVSTSALKVLVQNTFFLGNKSGHSRQFLDRLDELEQDKASLKDNRKLTLKSFESVAFRLIKGHVYLNTLQIMKLIGFSPKYLDHNPSKAYFIICKLLSQRGLNLESSFARQGKSKYCNISLHALFCLFETEFGPFKDKTKVNLLKSEILEAMNEQNCVPDVHLLQKLGEEGANDATSEKMIKIGSGFKPIRYKIKDNVLFLQRRACFDNIGLEKAIMTCTRGYTPINDILSRNGFDLTQSYLGGKRERFAFISVQALLTILDAQEPMIVCLENKEKFIEALLTTFQSGAAHALTFNSTKAEADLPAVHKLILMTCNQAIPFKICGNRIYLSRHISYGFAGLYDKAEGTSCHGEYDIFEDPVTPLKDRGLQGSDCFLNDGGDNFAYISIDGLLVLMNLDGDISRAGDYNRLIWKNLLEAIGMESPKLRVHIKMTEFKRDLIQTLLTKFINFLENAKAIENRGEDFVEIVDLVTEAEETEEEDEEMAALIKRPRLSSGSSSHSNEGGAKRRRLSDSSGILAEDLEPGEAEYINKLLQHSGIGAGASTAPRALGTRSPSSNSEMSDQGVGESPNEPLSARDYFTLKESTNANLTKNMIGDWHVVQCDEAIMRFVVEPGNGASRKMSFIHPDVSAILRYELTLKPSVVPHLLINHLSVSPKIIQKHVHDCVQKGILNLLYQILTLRPCFGSFAPEMVETVAKDPRKPDMFVDKTFIGSSQNGRTYAGTVRSRQCRVLAQSRVSDTCKECSSLKDLVINRSVLGENDSEEFQNLSKTSTAIPSAKALRKRTTSLSTDGKSHHKSVWKLEGTSPDAGCTFVCPQLQSYNTSLPHQFSGLKQASSIVEHRVHISHDLKATISLNGVPIAKSMPDFERNKQIAPLLEGVASFRLCVGYPDPELTHHARYLKANHEVLQPTIRKFFRHIEVDENFKGSMMVRGSSGSEHNREFQGTIRTPSCRYLAGEHSDICDECRLLQEPIEFLGL
ncbi:uncharacterized protein LOC131885977 [Tigriopus californicus]|uniref:uncharacterized protein LOC131885977 n=1 Tax=Tigriopus californicus TaxID=6832 RepID=UPI0027D9D1FC|nr:uncharacterized protein LOC131885977 [Tigriopus californicus]XP_059090176.1 uncharacterized protein LOC131885977 [Tigriopus californicus]|eukprot:TCALIF_08876-PB protein Name:"Protein of unknown function" AED:0.02 eAED:0.02 QI:1232/1/1/1/1/1/2/131/1791